MLADTLIIYTYTCISVTACHSDLDEFLAFLGGIKTQDGVGGDEAEDVFGGLRVAVGLSWQEGGTKVWH